MRSGTIALAKQVKLRLNDSEYQLGFMEGQKAAEKNMLSILRMLKESATGGEIISERYPGALQ